MLALLLLVVGFAGSTGKSQLHQAGPSSNSSHYPCNIERVETLSMTRWMAGSCPLNYKWLCTYTSHAHTHPSEYMNKKPVIVEHSSDNSRVIILCHTIAAAAAVLSLLLGFLLILRRYCCTSVDQRSSTALSPAAQIVYPLLVCISSLP